MGICFAKQAAERRLASLMPKKRRKDTERRRRRRERRRGREDEGGRGEQASSWRLQYEEEERDRRRRRGRCRSREDDSDDTDDIPLPEAIKKFQKRIELAVEVAKAGAMKDRELSDEEKRWRTWRRYTENEITERIRMGEQDGVDYWWKASVEADMGKLGRLRWAPIDRRDRWRLCPDGPGYFG